MLVKASDDGNTGARFHPAHRGERTLVSDLYLRLSWAMTLSISSFYATSIVFITTWVVNTFNLQIPDFLK